MSVALAEVEQRTSGWFEQRLGCLTASRMADMLAKTKSGPSASRANLLAQLVCERLTGKPTEHFESADMRRGSELEPEAIARYEAKTGSIIVPAGFVRHPSISFFGASPDGYVDEDGLIEVKCLNAANHIAILKGGDIGKYVPQVQTQLICTQRAWCDLSFWHPDFPEHLRLKIIRVAAHQDYQRSIEGEALRFLAEVTIEIKTLQELKVAA
ncbi:MAG: YqaJ viral recombinase family protein [Pseudomonadota bacterium]|nr:YqaJ viral recombinase family protein [Pseudomonadota bacterium]